jgi:hypothetical protein
VRRHLDKLSLWSPPSRVEASDEIHPLKLVVGFCPRIGSCSSPSIEMHDERLEALSASAVEDLRAFDGP